MHRLVLGVVAFMMVIGCSGEQPRQAGSQPALTPIHDARLRVRMARLEGLMIEELPDTMRGKNARIEIARAATELESEARRLPDLASTMKLDSDEMSLFYVFADSLTELASRLSVEAATGTAESVVARYEAIAETCVGCHNTFRALPE